MSRSPNAKYAIINSKGNLKSIVEYDENREVKKEHHFDHSDGGKKPHTMIIKNGKIISRNEDYIETDERKKFMIEFERLKNS